MPFLWIIIYASAWTLGLFVAVGVGHNMAVRRDKQLSRNEARRRFDQLAHEYQQAQLDGSQQKRAR